MTTNFLVVGGTGKTGRRVADRLRERGEKVRITSRRGVKVLTGPGHTGKLYELTGPRLLSFADAAAAASQGLLEEEVGALTELFAHVLDGRNESVTHDVARVLGPPGDRGLDAVKGKGKPMSTVVLVAALVAAGLIAGLFYAYACSVLPGLARGDDKTFVEGMRGINVAIINPVFMLTFLGAPLLAGVAVFLHFGSPSLPWVVAGFVCLAGMVLLTGAVHIPLNNALDRGGDDYAAVRAAFETTWVRWNVLRALVSTAGFGCLVGAVLTGRG